MPECVNRNQPAHQNQTTLAAPLAPPAESTIPSAVAGLVQQESDAVAAAQIICFATAWRLTGVALDGCLLHAGAGGQAHHTIPVDAHGMPLPTRPVQQPVQDRSDTRVSAVLSPREREALALIAAGFTHSQAAQRMGVTTATVDTFVLRIKAKLNAGNKADLTRAAMSDAAIREHVATVASTPRTD
jgi:DNA-binding CsgD family transcriptional regulator